jgi:hypothetical protein
MNAADLSRFLVDCREQLADVRPWVAAGRLTRINGLVMEAARASSCRSAPAA